MYCIHCGADWAGAFCGNCGKRQGMSSVDRSKETVFDQTDQQMACLQDSSWQCVEELLPLEDVHCFANQDAEKILPSDGSCDWCNRLDYQALLRSSSARKRLVAASSRTKPGITGEEVLAVLEAVVPGNVPLSKLTHAVVPIMDKLGIRTSNKSQAVWQAAPGRVLLSFLCVLASKSLAVDEVKQQLEACEITAKLPLGIITNPGKITAILEAKLGWVRISLSVTISGQLFDWGKSKKLIEEFLAEMNNDLVDQNAGGTVAYQRVA